MSALLAFVHSLLTTIPSLCTSLSSYLSTIISMTIITYPIAQQPILSPTWSQLQHSLQLLHHLADPLGDLIAHIGHLHTSLLLHHHLNDHHQFQIALLASSVSIGLVSSSARVTSANFQNGLLDVEQAWTSVFYLKSFDMDSVQVGKAVFGKEIFTTLGIEPRTYSYPGRLVTIRVSGGLKKKNLWLFAAISK